MMSWEQFSDPSQWCPMSIRRYRNRTREGRYARSERSPVGVSQLKVTGKRRTLPNGGQVVMFRRSAGRGLGRWVWSAGGTTTGEASSEHEALVALAVEVGVTGVPVLTDR